MAPKRKTAAKAAAEKDAAEAAAQVQENEVNQEETTEESVAVDNNNAEENVAESAPTLPVVESFTALQNAATADVATLESEHSEDFAKLLHAAVDEAGTPLLIRVRALEFIGKYIQYFKDASVHKNTLQALVKVVSGSDETPQLLIAALHAFAGLGQIPAESRQEYLPREAADVLMQVALDEDVFPAPVREAAQKALESLTTSAFRSVVSKVLHWVSNDRESDDEEQLAKERHLAFRTLNRLARSPKFRDSWTPEVQETVLSLLQVILTTAPQDELKTLVRMASGLPLVQEKGGAPLLDAFFAKNKLDSDRNLEALAIIGGFVTDTASYDVVSVLEQANLLNALDATSPQSVWQARIYLLAARTGEGEQLEKLLNAVSKALVSAIGDGSSVPENLSVLEALLLTLATLGKKCTSAVLTLIESDDFSSKAATLFSAVSTLEKEVVYAVKKLMVRTAATPQEAQYIACLHNIRVVIGAFATKHMPMGVLRDSWTSNQPLPVVKRSQKSGPSTTLQAGGAKRSRSGDGRNGGNKRSRPEGGNRGRGGNRGGNGRGRGRGNRHF